MGTSWSLHAVAASVDVRAIAEQAFADVIAQMSQWDETSELARFNRAPSGEPFAISAEFGRVMEVALAVQEKSGGAFNPAVGQLSEAWGFGVGTRGDGRPEARPVPVAAINFNADQRSIIRAEGVRLDLSGIAKGFAVDLVAERLLAANVRHFLIEIGGELRGEGIEPSGQPWWVEIAMPPTSSLPSYRLALHDLSVATSGNYRRGVEIDGHRYSHSFDPRRGAPIRHQTSSVTVLHRRCMFADAWATALTVMMPDDALAIAEREKIAMCMVVGEREILSAPFREYLN